MDSRSLPPWSSGRRGGAHQDNRDGVVCGAREALSSGGVRVVLPHAQGCGARPPHRRGSRSASLKPSAPSVPLAPVLRCVPGLAQGSSSAFWDLTMPGLRDKLHSNLVRNRNARAAASVSERRDRRDDGVSVEPGVKAGANLAKRTWPLPKRRDNAANCMRAAFFARPRRCSRGTEAGRSDPLRRA